MVENSTWQYRELNENPISSAVLPAVLPPLVHTSSVSKCLMQGASQTVLANLYSSQCNVIWELPYGNKHGYTDSV